MSSTNDTYGIDDIEALKHRNLPDNKSIGNATELYLDTSSKESQELIETKLNFLNKFAARFNTETKGVEPVADEERNENDGILNAASMWFSANMVLSAYAMGGLGPMVYGLNFGTSCLVILFFSILGLLPVAYFSLFGVQFGLRQMVLSRFLIGNVTARIFALINVVACVGWGVLNTVTSSQLLNMVNNEGDNLPLWGGCLIIIGATVIVTFFGYSVIHTYEKYSWIPNFAVFLVIIARLHTSGKFTAGEWTTGQTTAGDVLSFGSCIFGFAAGWTTYASDYTVYMPKNTNKYKIFFSLVGGLSFPLFFCMMIGAAVGRAGVNDAAWSDAYNSNGMGGLTYQVLVPNSLHGFGQFCCVLLAMSIVANNVPNMYTIALSVQAMWEPLANIPRVFWTLAGNAAALAIAIPCVYYFNTFMNYFMDSIGYYLAIYISMSLAEHLIFRKNDFRNYNVEDWNNWDKLPIGIAGTAGLIVGAFGVALGMDQTYWVGEISRLIGDYGGDIGFELGAGWAFIIYVAIRPLELKYFGR
ncbi:hypothetical protein KAFR_0L00890 [Kazachstania africana CBS 2517]|uniref:Purine-cytosine permease n=1 Tax=Kazachstania africana (strain ATCC 22294 / BCRC 22015 / CBS 2517 / CECT 1963 / NBRC 1671 / NRRL Y-8276) TaxID=1071382 RepID=H2B247_KAZAF|nr:hypothetical protein KAFR_0L00890 [Kazachstania africana CBS 2517]CCF60697.1 hypothetical protein KAFR_0L00890 [Kazachstania africana CBS 2517]